MLHLRLVLIGAVLTACAQTPLHALGPEATSGNEDGEPGDILLRSDAEALGCPLLFPEPVRETWQDISGERYRIDAAGRPERAIALLPPIASDKRDESCQRQVGQWGDALPDDEDYDGGHLIGAQLGGWGGRANLVPQVASFNRGNWLQMENAIASCAGDLEDGALRYTVTVVYDDAETLVPSEMSMELYAFATDESITLVFENVERGGADAQGARARGVQWLRDLGCE